MNLATVLAAIPVAALIIWALVKTIKNRGRCIGCSGGCAGCNGGCGRCAEGQDPAGDGTL